MPWSDAVRILLECRNDRGWFEYALQVLSDYGVKKRRHADFDAEQAAGVYVCAVLPAPRALGVTCLEHVACEATAGDTHAARFATEALTGA